MYICMYNFYFLPLYLSNVLRIRYVFVLFSSLPEYNMSFLKIYSVYHHYYNMLKTQCNA